MYAPMFFAAIAIGVVALAASQFVGGCLDADGAELELAVGQTRRFGCEGDRVKFVEAMSGPVIDVTCDGRTERLFLMDDAERACGASFRAVKVWKGGTPEKMNARLLIRAAE
jgi:hypothetical protein